MRNTLSKIFIFAAGAALGSAVTWKLTKEKYEKIAEEEIESVMTIFGDRKPKEKTDEVKHNDEKVTVEKPNIQEYVTMIKHANYGNPNINTEFPDVDTPYIITPEEYMDSDYECDTLVYYADDVLANDWFEKIEDVENTTGDEFKGKFGEYEEDCVYVRNDRLQMDFEILRDVRTYQEAKDNSLLLGDD